MRERPSARLLVISPEHKVLLFHFVHQDGQLGGQDYWATPGGGVEEGETFEAAAIRELREETGICVTSVGAPLAHRRFTLQMADGEWVTACERYFVVRAPEQPLSRADWTEEEKTVMAGHHWWSVEQLRATEQTVWPETLLDLLRQVAQGA